MSAKNHHCSLGIGSDSMLPRGTGWKLCRNIRKLWQVSPLHPGTYDYFYSYPAVLAERHKNIYENVKCIHPFSVFSLVWRSFMVLVNISHMAISTFRLCYCVEPVDDLKVHLLDHILMGVNVICMIDVLIKFNTGYISSLENGSKYIMLDRYSIFCHYLRNGFVIELISCLPIAYFFLHFYPKEVKYVFISHIISILRTLRICFIVAFDIKTMVQVFTKSYLWVGVIRLIIVFIMSAHFCSCILYIPPVCFLYWNGYVSGNHTRFLPNPEGILSYPMEYRYLKGIFISLSGFFATGFSMYRSSEYEETLLNALVILYSALFIVYNFVFILKIYMTVYNSTIRYNELMNQVEGYMASKQFPVFLRKRVRAHYNYRYQEQYFSESSVHSSLSDELRNEMTLHTCYKLLHKVVLFKDVPADVVGSVLGCLKPEVYLPNDSIQRVGDIGDCMYFIANGTVAVYSMKGIEVCHLDDGAHFGEVALLMKDSKRVSTVVAVEITELYRLDAKDFKQFILTNKVLYQRIEAIAIKRMYTTVLLDEELQKESKTSTEKFTSGSQDPF